MARYLIYIFPPMINVITSTLFFVCSLRMAESGASAFAVSMVCTAWAATYMLASLCASRTVTERNCVWIIIATCISLAIMSVLFLVFPGLKMQYVFMIWSGVALTYFFTPFQVFMKSIMGDSTDNFAKSIGFYTLSWSTGLALGPFFSSLVWKHFSWQACHIIDGIMALTCAIGIYLMKRYADSHQTLSLDSKPAEETVIDYTQQHDFAHIGWICGGICCLAIGIVRAVFPTLGTALNIPRTDQGTMFLILFLTQGVTGALLSFFRVWMYRAIPIAALTACGIGGLAMYSFGTTAHVFYLAAFVFGLYTGMSSFYLVFHSLVHPSKSTRNVAINEAIVGFTGIIGPMLGGVLADKIGLSSPFMVVGGLSCLALVIQFVIHTRHLPVPLSASEKTNAVS